MKSLLLVLVFIGSLIPTLNAQSQTLRDSLLDLRRQNDTLLNHVRNLLTRIDEASYIRIPKQEFDQSVQNTLQEKVDKQVGDKFDNLRNLVFLLLTLLGGGLLIALKSMISSNIKDQLDKEISALEKKTEGAIDKNEKHLEKMIEDKNDDLEQRQRYFEQGLNEKIEYIYLTTVKEKTEKEMLELKNIYESKIREVEETITALDSKIRLTRKNSIEYELYKMSTGRAYTTADFEKLKTYLGEARQLKDAALLSDIINALSKVAYYTKRETDMEPIIDEFMYNPEIDIKENAFINIAAGMFYTYASSGSKKVKEKAFSYIDKSLAKVPDYGEALGLKLEYYMVDYEYAMDNATKEEVTHNAALILKQVSMSEYAAKETIGRFDRVKANATERKFIEILYNLFSAELLKIESMRTPAVAN
jgi:hypothetical protein